MSIHKQFQEFLCQKKDELFGHLLKIIPLFDYEGNECISSDKDDNELLIRIIQRYILDNDTNDSVTIYVEQKERSIVVCVKKAPMCGCLHITLTSTWVTFRLDKAEWYQPVTFSSNGIESFIDAFFDYYPELKENILLWLKYPSSTFIMPKKAYLTDTFININ